MSKKNIHFFAMRDDLVEVLDAAKQIMSFKFAQGTDDERLPIVYQSVLDVPGFSVATSGDQNHCPRYLLIPEDALPVPRTVVMNDGRVRNFLNEGGQPSSVSLIPGGLYSSGGIIIAGDINTMTADQWTQNLHKVLRKFFTMHFKRVNGVYVGKQAYQKLKEGWRLNSSIKAPVFTDLAEPLS
ncbi:hypothetical protein M2262_002827 [Pseudomonas sp. BIGb0408]|uniref:Uncharacterized protein n=1 Tax=Phytopseudomonas flavescens TaxID=29435 RepID=A0A7Z0BQ12_9GAMM|nr:MULTISPECIES: hypothetical protein [Pseudomonas]MCW2292777.1 hypothetical protein [Pseudomonas sp. BIGb0408]NYH72653.1 hypothetical protein [Pseudomonas flavescens]